MAYPTITQARGSKIVPVSGVKYDNSVSGKLRGVFSHSEEAVEITVAHSQITDAERATLDAHWQSNENAQFTFTSDQDGNDYTVTYKNRPQFVYIAPGHWNVTVALSGVKA